MAAKTVKWNAAWLSRGSVADTGPSDFNNLSDPGNWTAIANSPEIDNSANKDKWGKLVLNVTFGTGAGAGGCLLVYMLTAPDGTNYEDGGTAVDPGLHTLIAVIPVKPTITTAQLLTSKIFPMQPAKTKFLVLNKANANLASTGNTMTLYTTNESVNN